MTSKQAKPQGTVASLEARIKRVVQRADSQHVRAFMGGLWVYLVRYGELSPAQRAALGKTESRVFEGDKSPNRVLKNIDSALGKQQRKTFPART